MNGQEMFEKLSNMSEDERTKVFCFDFNINYVKSFLSEMRLIDSYDKMAVDAMTDDDLKEILDNTITNFEDHAAFDDDLEDELWAWIIEWKTEYRKQHQEA